MTGVQHHIDDIEETLERVRALEPFFAEADHLVVDAADLRVLLNCAESWLKVTKEIWKTEH